MRSPTPTLALQSGLLDSIEASFSLTVYAEAMACASLRSGPTCVPRPGRRVDPKVLKYLDVDVTVDTSFLSDCSNSGCSSRSGDIYGDCSDNCISSKLFAVALPTGLLPFVFPFMFCSETKRATAFDFYGHVSVMWTK